jgi:hypothetical protein
MVTGVAACPKGSPQPVIPSVGIDAHEQHVEHAACPQALCWQWRAVLKRNGKVDGLDSGDFHAGS